MRIKVGIAIYQSKALFLWADVAHHKILRTLQNLQKHPEYVR